MFKKNYLLKLARMIMKFGEVETDKGMLTYEGDLAVGTEVFIEVDGELVPAENGEYKAEDKIYVIEEGKVAEIKEVEVEEPVEEPKEEPKEEPVAMDDAKVAELEAKIAELEAQIVEKDVKIAELESQVAEKEEQLQMSVAKPAHKEVKDVIVSTKENKALKYFQ